MRVVGTINLQNTRTRVLPAGFHREAQSSGRDGRGSPLATAAMSAARHCGLDVSPARAARGLPRSRDTSSGEKPGIGMRPQHFA
jgi:hypothetical protein